MNLKNRPQLMSIPRKKWTGVYTPKPKLR